MTKKWTSQPIYHPSFEEITKSLRIIKLKANNLFNQGHLSKMQIQRIQNDQKEIYFALKRIIKIESKFNDKV